MGRTINNVICSLGVFVLSFCWSAYCLKDSVAASICAAVITASFATITELICANGRKNKLAKKQSKQQTANFTEFVRYNENNALLFESMLAYYGFVTIKKDYDNVVATKNNCRYLVAFRYETKTVCDEEMCKTIRLCKREHCDKILVFCEQSPPQNKQNNGDIELTFCDVNNTIALLKQAEKMPKLPLTKKTKSHFVANYAFCKKRFPLYFSSGLFMLFSSLFAVLKIYSLLWGTVFVLLAVYSLLNTRYNSKKTSLTLE